jgi:hypothetical protein
MTESSCKLLLVCSHWSFPSMCSLIECVLYRCASHWGLPRGGRRAVPVVASELCVLSAFSCVCQSVYVSLSVHRRHFSPEYAHVELKTAPIECCVAVVPSGWATYSARAKRQTSNFARTDRGGTHHHATTQWMLAFAAKGRASLRLKRCEILLRQNARVHASTNVIACAPAEKVSVFAFSFFCVGM